MSKYDYIMDIIKENTTKGKNFINNKFKSSDNKYASDISNATESLANEINPEDNTELYKKLALALGIGGGEGALIYHLLQNNDEEILDEDI